MLILQMFKRLFIGIFYIPIAFLLGCLLFIIAVPYIFGYWVIFGTGVPVADWVEDKLQKLLLMRKW